MKYTSAVITVSDSAFHGQRIDSSGPNLAQLLTDHGYTVIHTAIVPDETEQIQRELLYCADQLHTSLILTTGGTGFSPRDITPEATMPLIQRPVPGIPEAMRSKSMEITPRGCLSRCTAGIRSRSLIINLPGSKKASQENLLAVIDALEHGLDMLAGQGSADCAPSAAAAAKQPPSLELWLNQAKASEIAPQIGMYLTHSGVVRQSAKAQVRDGQADAGCVSGMLLTHDPAKVDAAVRDTLAMPGIYCVRVWVNEGQLKVGDTIMQVLIGGDIRPRVLDALQYLLSRLKNECITEQELYAEHSSP